MKKFIAAVAALLVTALGAFAQSPAQSGTIRELSGDVQLKPTEAAVFSPAHAGSEVTQNTIVSTGFKSTALIAVGSSVITVRPLTRLSLAEIQTSSETENINMNLQTGRVKVDVKPPVGTKANFTVQSPSATASVRGTSFEFDTRNLRVIEGKVSFRGSRGASMPVPAGSESSVGNEGSAADPIEKTNETFQPPPPVGADSVEGTTAPPSVGEINIEIVF